MTKIRVAIVVPALNLGGGVPAVARFLRDVALGDDRFEIKLISLSTSATDSLSLRLASPRSWIEGAKSEVDLWEGLPVTNVGAVIGELEFQRYLPRAVLTRALSDCHVVQVVCGAASWANAALGLGKPIAIHVATRTRVERRLREAIPSGISGIWRKAMTVIADRLDSRALRHADAIQVMNPWMLNYARNLNVGRIVDLRYAPPGVDTVRFLPVERTDLDLNPYILCVGRFSDPRKNIGLLLSAYALLPHSARNGVRLLLAGSSEPPGSFWESVQRLDLEGSVIYFHNPDQDELVRLYQRASMLVSPSDEEGFGMVLIEAMACGIPVVATRSGGPDGIVNDGEDGFLVPLNDERAMATRIQQLVQDSDLNIAMGIRARRKVENIYSQEIAGLVFKDVWQSLAANVVNC
jgi:glycosyltransferase involved in cell wall biosynthesis